MAWSDATLVLVVAEANGTNNFVLSDPASQGPHRTDVQAVADGSLSNGEEVHYEAWRTTTEGDAEFERGHGIYTSSTRTIARTAGNVRDGSGGPGVLVDFGLSGQMDVLFLPPLDGSDIPSSAHATFASNLGLPRLSASNTFANDSGQILSGSATEAFSGLTLRNDNTGSLNNRSIQRFQLKDDAGSIVIANRLESRLSTITAGSTESRFDIYGMVAGVIGLAVRVQGQTLQDGSGNQFIAAASGAVLLSESIWTGWTAGYATDNRLIRLAQSGDTLGGQAGAGDPFSSWSTEDYTLQISEIPSHTHTQRVDNGIGGGGSTFPTRTLSSAGAINDGQTDSAGGGDPHAHTIATPKHRVMLRIIKS